MPNTKSAIRRVRRVKKQTAVNKVRKSKYKSAVKQMEILIKKGDKKPIKEKIPNEIQADGTCTYIIRTESLCL